MTEGSDPDWAAIRRAVEAGGETMVAIGARFGVAAQAIYARKHRWAWDRRIDTSSAAGIERGLNKLIRQIFAQLRRVAAANRAMNRDAKAQARSAEGGATMARRLAWAAEAEARLGSMMKLTAEFTRLLDRAAKTTAAERAAQDEYKESHEQFESRLLGYLERIRAEAVRRDDEPEGQAAAEP